MLFLYEILVGTCSCIIIQMICCYLRGRSSRSNRIQDDLFMIFLSITFIFAVQTSIFTFNIRYRRSVPTAAAVHSRKHSFLFFYSIRFLNNVLYTHGYFRVAEYIIVSFKYPCLYSNEYLRRKCLGIL